MKGLYLICTAMLWAVPALADDDDAIRDKVKKQCEVLSKETERQYQYVEVPLINSSITGEIRPTDAGEDWESAIGLVTTTAVLNKTESRVFTLKLEYNAAKKLQNLLQGETYYAMCHKDVMGQKGYNHSSQWLVLPETITPLSKPYHIPEEKLPVYSEPAVPSLKKKCDGLEDKTAHYFEARFDKAYIPNLPADFCLTPSGEIGGSCVGKKEVPIALSMRFEFEDGKELRLGAIGMKPEVSALKEQMIAGETYAVCTTYIVIDNSKNWQIKDLSNLVAIEEN